MSFRHIFSSLTATAILMMIPAYAQIETKNDNQPDASPLILAPAPPPTFPPASSPALSQRAASGRPNGSEQGNSDFILIGIGAGVSANYSGADSYDFLPTPLVIGRYKGFDFVTRGPGVMVDLVRDKRGNKVDFILGPQFRFRFDRNDNSDIDDVQVAALTELDTAFELGVSAGLKINKILSPYDNLTFMLDATWDVAGAHGGAIISPSLSYSTPLNAGTVVRLTGGINYVSDDFVETYSSIDAANSIASGLAEFTASKGVRDANISLLIAIDLDNNVRNGGWGIFGLGNYSRLLGDTARSPIVTETGSPNQFFGALGIGYSF